MNSATITQMYEGKDANTGLHQVAASQLRQHFGSILDQVTVAGESLLLVSHKKPRAVLVPYETYLSILKSKMNGNMAEGLLAAHYDAMILHMNTPVARAAVDKTFASGPEDFASLRVGVAS
jgi:prevent-host-death family protein